MEKNSIYIIIFGLCSCGTSKKTVDIIKARVDSAVIEISNNVHKTKIDSTTLSTEGITYTKTITSEYLPIEVSKDDTIVHFYPLVIKKKSGIKNVYLPKYNSIENGTKSKKDSSSVSKDIDSVLNVIKNTNVKSDVNTVVKNKITKGMSWYKYLWFLLLIPIFIGIKYLKTLLKL